VRTVWCRTALAREHLAVSPATGFAWLLILSVSSMVIELQCEECFPSEWPLGERKAKAPTRSGL
jgi:hypothetical protein